MKKIAPIVAIVLLLAACRPGPEQIAVRDALNRDRVANDLPVLPINMEVQSYAQAWAEHLAATGPLVHSNVRDNWLIYHPRYCGAGENVGYGMSVKHVEEAYMLSPGHKANIVGTWQGVGVGYATRPSGHGYDIIYTVQVFVRRC